MDEPARAHSKPYASSRDDGDADECRPTSVGGYTNHGWQHERRLQLEPLRSALRRRRSTFGDSCGSSVASRRILQEPIHVRRAGDRDFWILPFEPVGSGRIRVRPQRGVAGREGGGGEEPEEWKWARGKRVPGGG